MQVGDRFQNTELRVRSRQIPHRSGSAALVSMVQSADLGHRHH
jgi:hypothetical protein